MKVLFYCGIRGCERKGTLIVETADWERKAIELKCPSCGVLLRQSDFHFEDFNLALHRERAAICHRPGPLSHDERERLREIHELLGHGVADDFTEEQESLVMKIASDMMARVRNEEKN